MNQEEKEMNEKAGAESSFMPTPYSRTSVKRAGGGRDRAAGRVDGWRISRLRLPYWATVSSALGFVTVSREIFSYGTLH